MTTTYTSTDTGTTGSSTEIRFTTRSTIWMKVLILVIRIGKLHFRASMWLLKKIKDKPVLIVTSSAGTSYPILAKTLCPTWITEEKIKQFG